MTLNTETQLSNLIGSFNDDELDEFNSSLTQLVGQKQLEEKVNQNPSYLELFKEGLQESTGNLITEDIPGFKQLYEYADIKPMPTLKEEALRGERDLTFLQNLSKGAGGLIGDLPSMTIGGIAGGLAGTELGSLSLITGGAGAFAFPTLLKTSHHEYQKFFEENPESDVTFEEYLEAAGRVSKETGKSAVIGGATAVVAPLIGYLAKIPGLSTLLKSKATRKAAETIGEATTITAGTAAFQGEWPSNEQFAENLLLLAGFHGSKAVAKKFGNWARGKGLSQAEAIEVLDNLNEAQMKAFDEAESIDDIQKIIELKQITVEEDIEQKSKDFDTSREKIQKQHKKNIKTKKQLDETYDSQLEKLINLQSEISKKGRENASTRELLQESDLIDSISILDEMSKDFKEEPHGKVANISTKIQTDFSSTKIIKEPKVLRDKGLIETRGKGEIFHGSKGLIEKLTDGNYASFNYYGQGFYTTDSINIARGYANHGKGIIYNVNENPGLKFFDMEIPFNKMTPKEQQIIESSLEIFISPSKKDSLREIYDEMRDQQESADTIQEYLLGVQDGLEGIGYDGYIHKGGLRTNNKPHEVKIYFNPHKDVSINEIDLKNYSSTIKKAKGVSKKIPSKVLTYENQVKKLKEEIERLTIDNKNNSILLKNNLNNKPFKQLYQKALQESFNKLQEAKHKLKELKEFGKPKSEKLHEAKPPVNIRIISSEDLPPPENLEVSKDEKGNEVVKFKKVTVEEPVKDSTYFEAINKIFKDISSRWNKYWNVEAPFKAIGGNETGRKAKLFYNTIEKHQRDAIDLIKKIVKIYDRKDRGILALLSEGKELPEMYQEKYKEGYDLIRKYFDDSFKELKEVDALTKPFPESLIDRIVTENEELLEKYRKAKNGRVKANIYNKLLKNREAIKKLENSAFVHIPYSDWFMNQYGKGEKGQRIINSINSLTNKQRKSISIGDLLTSKAIKPEQIDIVDIIGSYGMRKGKDLAIYDIMKQAQSEGLASKTRIKNYEKIPKWASNVANKFYVHPVVYDYLVPMLKREPSAFLNFMGKMKGYQFYNPLFLPGYDLFQATMLGTVSPLRPIKSAKYFVKAAKDIYNRSKDYHEAMKEGLASSPFNITRSEYNALIKQTKQSLPENILDWMSPKIVSKIYNASSNLAWHGDRLIRMASYNRLIELEYSPKDAAEVAATFHADYASIPATTRRSLNKIYFTPTFKVAMGKLFKEMFKAPFKIGKSILKGENINPKDRLYAEGLVNTAAMLGTIHLFFTSNGFETDIFGYRYSKPIKTEDGEDKELVIVLPSPTNLPIKYIGRAYQSFTDPGEINAWEKFSKQMSWEIHPLWRTAYNLISNKSESGHNITDTVANTPGQRFYDRMKYIMKQTMPWTQISEIDPESEKSLKEMDKELGQVFELMFRPFSNHYIRDSFEKRQVIKVKKLANALRERQIRSVFDPKTDPLTDDQIERYMQQIQKVIKELDDYRSKKK